MRLLLRAETNEVDTDDRAGAYRSVLSYIADIGNGGSDLHPCPFEDAGLREWWTNTDNVRPYLFGFATVSHYLNWFMYRTGRDAMHEAGGVLSIYLVPDKYFREGQFQAVMHREHSTHLGDLALNLPRHELELIFKHIEVTHVT